MPPPQLLRCGVEAARVLPRYTTVVFDLDGVVWIHENPIARAAEALSHLHTSGINVFFVTNFAKPRREVAEKFKRLGFGGPHTHIDRITTSASAAADLLSAKGYAGKKVYVVGEPGLAEELHHQGIVTLGTHKDGHIDGLKPPIDHSGFMREAEEFDPGVRAVVCGMDWRASYRKIATASWYIQNGAEFIAANADLSSPSPTGERMPGAGSLVVRPIEIVTKKSATIAAKPNPTVLHQLIAKHGLDKSKVLMVGDRMDTDIEFGNAAGVDTLLVLSGTTAESEVHAGVADKHTPTYIADSIEVFLHAHAGVSKL
eukprot:TRINITY_DN11017_c0_g2_i1.p1 TRINITY_DN11017_c0_g2~~TRINITY_DN11017_c0_g2_i1.p1  ORF type:complete len:314 (+),score=89.51 TRINITY_DN11017_c0_g2_i1:155-1096(+)